VLEKVSDEEIVTGRASVVKFQLQLQAGNGSDARAQYC